MSDLRSVERVRDRNARRFWPKIFSCVLAVLGLLIGQSVVAQDSWITINGVGTLPVGFIESVTNPFCGNCSRARLSAHGSIYTCLFSEQGFDLRGVLRFGANEQQIAEIIRDIWTHRGDRYSELRHQLKDSRQPVEMSFIGG